MTSNEIDKALKVLERVARVNGKALPRGRLVSKAEKERIKMKGSGVDFLAPEKKIIGDASDTDEKDDPVMGESTALIKSKTEEPSLVYINLGIVSCFSKS